LFCADHSDDDEDCDDQDEKRRLCRDKYEFSSLVRLLSQWLTGPVNARFVASVAAHAKVLLDSCGTEEDDDEDCPSWDSNEEEEEEEEEEHADEAC